MGYTIAEKILARASGNNQVKAGEYVTARPDYVMCPEAAAGVYLRMMQAGIDSVWDRDRIIVILDHYSPAPTIRAAEIQKLGRIFAQKFGITHFYGEKPGICHQVMPELGFIAPGRLVIAADSHATTYGAFGCAGTGIGYLEMAHLCHTGEIWLKVPETIRFEIHGKKKKYVMGKDIILHIAGIHKVEIAQYKSIEFHGPSAGELSLASRMTICNMAVELGAKFGFFLPDDIVHEYLNPRIRDAYDPVFPDENAIYEACHDIDLNELEPLVSCPHRIDDVRPVSTLGHVRIDQAFLGSCTNGRLEDLQAAAEILKGRKVHKDVRLIVTPASREIYLQAIREGFMEIIVKAEAIVNHPGCGACFGAHQGLLAAGEVCVSTSNRNFRGRMGSPASEIYLANPYVVAASSVAGRIIHPDEL